jgi:AbrB family looped-hinge helix DNA binding protein
MTVTVGKRGTIVIPKQIRTQCHMEEGAELEVSMVNNVITLTPSIYTRTRLDENFDSMREILTANGVTLESAMAALREMRAANE